MSSEKKVVIIAGPNGADCWQLFDNSGKVPLLLDEGTNP